MKTIINNLRFIGLFFAGLSAAFGCVFAGCAHRDELLLDHREITLKTTMTNSGEIVSYLGSQDCALLAHMLGAAEDFWPAKRASKDAKQPAPSCDVLALSSDFAVPISSLNNSRAWQLELTADAADAAPADAPATAADAPTAAPTDDAADLTAAKWLPFASQFRHNYLIIAPVSSSEQVLLCFHRLLATGLASDASEPAAAADLQCATVPKRYKSLDYHLEGESQ